MKDLSNALILVALEVNSMQGIAAFSEIRKELNTIDAELTLADARVVRLETFLSEARLYLQQVSNAAEFVTRLEAVLKEKP